MNNLNVAIPTPFLEDESLNPDGFEPIVEHLKRNGIQSLLISGSTGEQHSMSVEERLQIIDYFKQKNFADVELMFGVSAVRTKDAVRLVQALEHSVFQAILIGFPPYIRPTQQQAIAYVEELLAHTTKKIALYNNPARTGFDLSPESLHELIGRHHNIVGFKEGGDVHRHKGIAFPDSFIRFAAGDVNLVANIVEGGCNGLSSVAGNMYPEVIKRTFEDLLQNKPVDAMGLEQLVSQVIQGQAIVNIKNHYNSLGMNTGYCRSPLGI
ncbi:dihydrodipicolinate synthase family protein [Paenibacillus sp. sgz500958]|uniref:dihydrodipicolinate synthase family protein n=1 Tax=Paenibacillus sp. sgz500958 TaxID=3242475 RepID=UPI0036D2304A